MGPSRGGPIRILPFYPATSLLQLEAGPSSRGNGCLQPVLGTVQEICESSLVSDRQGSITSEKPTSSDNSGSPSMEGPTMVPSPAGNAVRFPTATTSGVSHNPENIQSEPDGPSIPTSHLACLRQKFSGGNLSEAAKDLFLASWRGKTSRAYDSHFRKWLGWCDEQSLDPI